MHRIALSIALFMLLSCGGAAKKSTNQKSPDLLPPRTYTHYLRGQLAFARNNFSLAVEELASAKRSAPDQPPISLALAEAHYLAGNRSAAQRELGWALQQWPKDASIWLASAQLHMRGREFASASTAYKRAIALGARGDDAYLAFGDCLLTTGDTSRAKAVFRKLIARRNTSSAEAHYRLARLLHGAQVDRDKPQLNKGLIHAKAATAEAPYNLDAWALLAATLQALGRESEAHNALRAPFDRSQGASNVGEQLVISLLDLGERKLAWASVAVLDRDDLPVDTRINMGHWLLRAGDFEGALSVATRLSTLSPGSAAIAELRARALRALHRAPEAEVALGTVAATSPGYPLMQSMLGHLYTDLGDASRGATVVREALEKFPDNPDLVMASAAVAEALGDLAKSREILTRALSRHPGALRPRFSLAELETRAGNSDAAIATIRPLLEANPRSFTALNYIGYSLINTPSALPRARDLLLRALELAPDSAFVLDSYGWFLFRTGERKAATPLLERAVRLTPTEPELLAHLAELRWEDGKRDEAHALLAKARALALTRHTRKVIDSLQNRLTASIQGSQP